MTPKEHGKHSANKLDGFIEIFEEVDDFTLDGDSLREMDLDVPYWDRMYELSFGELAGIAMIGLGVLDQLHGFNASQCTCTGILSAAGRLPRQHVCATRILKHQLQRGGKRTDAPRPQCPGTTGRGLAGPARVL